MDDRNQNQQELLQEQERYIPRPAWQVWAARIGLVLFLLVVAYQIFSIAGAGA